MQDGPIDLGECTLENWLEKVKPVIEKRIEKYSSSEIRFNLLAVCRNLQTRYKEQIALLESRRDAATTKITQIVGGSTGTLSSLCCAFLGGEGRCRRRCDCLCNDG